MGVDRREGAAGQLRDGTQERDRGCDEDGKMERPLFCESIISQLTLRLILYLGEVHRGGMVNVKRRALDQKTENGLLSFGPKTGPCTSNPATGP